MRERVCRLALLLVVAALPGCFVNEIDKSMEIYEGKSAKEPAPADAPAAGAQQAQAKPSGPSWWETARTLGSEPMDETITSCALGGRIEFQRRDDCLARGGQPR